MFLFKTPGAAAARLTESPEHMARTSLAGGRVPPCDLRVLVDGARGGRLVDLERRWADELRLRKVELPRFEVQPYGTMVQWALDEALYE